VIAVTPYELGYKRTMKTAGLEKTALPEKLLRKLLTAEYGEHAWDTRGILKGMRTGEALPVPSTYNNVRGIRQRRIAKWTDKYSPYVSPEDTHLGRARQRRLHSQSDILHQQHQEAWDKWLALVEPHEDAYNAALSAGGNAKEKFFRSVPGLSEQTSALDASEAAARSNARQIHLQNRASTSLANRLSVQSNHRSDGLALSGRHGPSARINIPQHVDQVTGEVVGGPGLDPANRAYRSTERAGVPWSHVPNGPRQPIAAADPRWVSGYANTAAGYNANPQDTFHAYDLRKVPARHKGPSSPHVATDTRMMSEDDIRVLLDGRTRVAGRAAQGDAPDYERVITQSALHPAETHRYKRLSDGSYMRVKGKASDDPLLS